MSSLVPAGRRVLAASHPGLELVLTDTHPEEALQLLRAGQVDIAVIFRYDDTAPEDDGIRLTHLLDDPLYLLTLEGGTTLSAHRESPWVGGCDRCRSHLVELCEAAGFSPRLAYTTDDMVVMQSLVAAGMGVTTIPGLALRAHRHPAITATRLDAPPLRRIYAATYGEPPTRRRRRPCWPRSPRPRARCSGAWPYPAGRGPPDHGAVELHHVSCRVNRAAALGCPALQSLPRGPLAGQPPCWNAKGRSRLSESGLFGRADRI